MRRYSRSSPRDHSRKNPALVTTTFLKPRLNCDFYFVMKSTSSLKRPRPILGLPNRTFFFVFNPLSSTSDQHQISPCNITALQNTEVRRIEDVITKR